jgi:hypothetical protein
MEDENLNADAIYEAMCFLRAYAESEEGKAATREMMITKADKIDAMRGLAPKDADFRPVPRFEFDSEFIERIFPGEKKSVEVWLNLARYIIWGTPTLAEALMSSECKATSEAVRRFIADRAN